MGPFEVQGYVQLFRIDTNGYNHRERYLLVSSMTSVIVQLRMCPLHPEPHDQAMVY